VRLNQSAPRFTNPLPQNTLEQLQLHRIAFNISPIDIPIHFPVINLINLQVYASSETGTNEWHGYP
jgi:hypothetical protein